MAQVESEGDEVTEQLPPAIKVEGADGDVSDTTGIGDDEEVPVEAEESVHSPADTDEVFTVAEEAAAVQMEDTKNLPDEAMQESKPDSLKGELEILDEIPEESHSVVEASTTVEKSTMSIPKIAITDDDNVEVDLASDEEVSRLPDVQLQTSTEVSSGEDATMTCATVKGPDESETSSVILLTKEKDVVATEDGPDAPTAESDGGVAPEKIDMSPEFEPSGDLEKGSHEEEEEKVELASEERDSKAQQIPEEILVEIDAAPEKVGKIEAVEGEDKLPERQEQCDGDIKADKKQVVDAEKSECEPGEIEPADENQPHENIPDSDIPNATQDRQGRRRSSSCSSAETQVALKIALTYPPLLKNEVLPCVRACDYLLNMLSQTANDSNTHKDELTTILDTKYIKPLTDFHISYERRWATGSRVLRSAAAETSSAT